MYIPTFEIIREFYGGPKAGIVVFGDNRYGVLFDGTVMTMTDFLAFK